MNKRRRPTALLIDFDGVLRRHDPAVAAAVEAAAGLYEGEILAAGLEPALQIPAVLGRVSRAGWRMDIAAAIADRVGGLERAEHIVNEWDAYRGEIVPEVRDTVAAVRAAGIPVALCTNATDDLRDDLEALDIADAFDVVVSSAEIGLVKPMREFYQAACDAVGAAAADCLLVDDTLRNVDGARAAGLLGYRYTGLGDLGYLRAALGV